MAAVARKDPAAQRELVERLGRRVRRVSGLLCRSAADAEDAAQLSLIEILRSAEGFRVGTSLERWAERVTARTALRAARRERDRKGLLERWLPGDANPWGGSATERAGEPSDLDAFLDRLSPERRQVFVLRHGLEYTVEEIADLTGAPAGTVKDRLVHARRQLRDLIEREDRRARGGDR